MDESRMLPKTITVCQVHITYDSQRPTYVETTLPSQTFEVVKRNAEPRLLAGDDLFERLSQWITNDWTLIDANGERFRVVRCWNLLVQSCDVGTVNQGPSVQLQAVQAVVVLASEDGMDVVKLLRA